MEEASSYQPLLRDENAVVVNVAGKGGSEDPSSERQGDERK